MRVYQHEDLIRQGGQEQTVYTPSHLIAARGSGKRIRRGPHCENCDLETEILFDGFKFENSDAQSIRTMSFKQLQRLKYYSEPFATQKAMVCHRCRPLSNLEVAEMSGGAEIIRRSA